MKKTLSFFCLILLLACKSDTMDVYDAARKGNLEVIANAHSKDGESIGVPNHRGHTPLILACYRGQLEAAKLLVKLGVDVNYSCDLGTALHAAVYQDDFEITEVLLKNKADINAVDAKNKSVLMTAIHNSSTKMVTLLLAYQPDVTLVDTSGKTAFIHAMELRNEAIIQLLKK